MGWHCKIHLYSSIEFFNIICVCLQGDVSDVTEVALGFAIY